MLTTAKKYLGIIFTALLAVLAFSLFNRKSTDAPPPSDDVDHNGIQDDVQIQNNIQDADKHRENADNYVQAAQAAVAKPIAVTPSNDVEESVNRNNNVDY